jgi:TPR repeat protein
MKYFLILCMLTSFTLASNPFNTLIKKPNKFSLTYQLALKGDINAQFNIAMMYGTGSYVKENKREAFNWLHKSAMNGHVQAKYLMGVSFKQGTGVRV